MPKEALMPDERIHQGLADAAHMREEHVHEARIHEARIHEDRIHEDIERVLVPSAAIAARVRSLAMTLGEDYGHADGR
ncbi:MAG: hypothetical protein DWI09_07835, partial [Planctomycetota bacterium]